MLVVTAIPLQQIHEGAQLQPGDVGPSAAFLHGPQQVEQLGAVGGQAAAKGAVLQVAMQLLDLAQQGQQGLGLTVEIGGNRAQISQGCVEALLLLITQRSGTGAGRGNLCRHLGGSGTPIQVVESRDIVRESGILHR